jgi:hypothetical protein
VGGTLAYNFKANEVGSISYRLAFEELERLSVPRDSFAPYLTDWRLQMQVGTGAWSSIMGGIHVPVNLQTDADAVDVAGKDWAHWLEQPVWFNYYNYNYDQAGAATATRKRDVVKEDHSITGTAPIINRLCFIAFPPGCIQSTMIRTLLDNSKQGTNYVNINPVFSGTAGSAALTLQAYVIMFQDATTILQHINNIAQLDEPYGFDWTMNAGKTMEFFGPRKQLQDAPVRTWTINRTTNIEQPLLQLDWTNNGPVGTHIVGTSNGNPGPWYNKRDQDSVDKYRQWLKIEQLGDQYILGPDMRHALDGLQYMYPQKDVKINVYPEVLDNLDAGAGFRNHVGDVVRMYWDFDEYHTVDAYYWITGQDFATDPSGNWKCDLSLQQIYDNTKRTSGGV